MRTTGPAKSAIFYIVSGFIAICMLFPYFWMLSTSLKTNREIFETGAGFLPEGLHWENYTQAFRAAPWETFFANSAIVAVIVTIGQLLFSAMGGYAFGRLSFFGKNALFALLLAGIMVPAEVTLIPLFLIVKNWPLAGGNDWLGMGGTGLLNTYTALILPKIAGVFGLFLMRQFFLTLPKELDESARIDGCGELRLFWSVMLPLVKPAAATLGIFTFTSIWDEFFWPLVVVSERSMMTVQLGLTVFKGVEGSIEWGPLMAATVLVSLPVIVVFLLGQRYFVESIATTGIKG